MSLLPRHATLPIILILLGQALPMAAAQPPFSPSGSSDLVVDHIELGSAVVGRPATLTVFVKNVGGDTFSSTGGWQLFLGYRDPANSFDTNRRCLDTNQQAEGTSNVCYQRVQGTDDRRTIPPGTTREFSTQWTPSRQDQAGVVTIVTQIEPLFCEQGVACDGSDPVGPDAVYTNNVQEHRVYVKAPAVRAVPLRDAPPQANANQNTAWTAEDIQEACKLAPEVSKKGCKAKPDTLIVFEYLVINEGNSGDTFTARLVEPNPQLSTSLTSREFFKNTTFQPRDVAIAEPGGSKVVRVEILIPKGEKAINTTNVPTVTAVIEWSSQLDPTQTTSSPPEPRPCTTELKAQGLCQNPSYPSLDIDVSRSLTVNTTDSWKQANVSQLDEFNFTLNNTGNSDDRFSLKLDVENSQINDSWVPNFPAFVNVPAFSEQRVTMTVMPPANATKGVHTFQLKAQSVSDTDGSTLRPIRFNPDLQQYFGLTGSLDAELLRVVPADTAGYVLRIANAGNGHDNVTLTLENVPFGWTGALSERTIQVPPFSTVPVYLNVTPPENTLADTHASFFLNATSQGPTEKAPEQRPKIGLVARMTVLAGSNIRILSPVASAFVDPGASHDFDLVIRNTGNARDNFTVILERDQSQLAWGATATPGFLVLDPLQQANLRVTLRAPTTGAVGETTKVFVTLRSTTDTARFKQATLDGRVSGPDLFVSAVVANATQPYSGDPLELNIVLGNGGNKAPLKNATLKLYFVPQTGAQRPIAERTYAPTELAGARRVAERILWDTTGIEGSGTILARIDEANEIAEIDESPASNEATRAITLRVFDIRLTPAQGLSGRPGERVSYTGECPASTAAATATVHVFCVEYRGNQPSEPVDIIIESEHGWGSSRLALALPRGSVIPILADVTIPASPGFARDTLRVTVIPSLRPEAVVSATVTTTVTDDEPPRILGVIAQPQTAKLGETITIRADVTDATGLSSVRAFVITPNNESQAVVLRRTEGSNSWTYGQSWPAAGIYRFFVEAIDGSDAQNKNSSRDTVVTFTVSPGSAPLITLADGQVTTIRTGTLVRLNITDPLGVSKATYSIRGISYDLPRPFTIDTSSFTAGTVDLTVTAENIYGVASSAKFTLTVDNTPPGIRSVTLDPEDPKANQDVTLRIETDPKVSAVEVLIKKDGQVLDSRAAIKKGSGIFELLLNPGEGEYVLDVTAKDAAGNSKLQEGAVSFSAKPASPFDVPAPSLGLLAIAVVALALVLRRRGR